jgi:flagellar assembly protein FliH
MASKLIIGEKAAAAHALIWRGANAGPQPPQGPEPDPQEENKKKEQDEERERQLRVLMTQQSRIQELEREVETRPKQAYQQGYNEGQAAGVKQANARIEPAMAKLAQSIQELTGVRKRHLIAAEEDAVRLAIAVARKVLRRELSVDPESLLGVVKAAFERVDARDVHRIRLNPEDGPILQRHLVTIGMPPRVELIPDPALERGGVVIETNRGLLDASVSSQLSEIERGLVDLVRRSS